MDLGRLESLDPVNQPQGLQRARKMINQSQRATSLTPNQKWFLDIPGALWILINYLAPMGFVKLLLFRHILTATTSLL